VGGKPTTLLSVTAMAFARSAVMAAWGLYPIHPLFNPPSSRGFGSTPVYIEAVLHGDL
jgi:hypothetical protein